MKQISKAKKAKQPKSKKIILTIRATKEPEIKALNELKDATGEKTYTGAIMKAAMNYKSQQKRIDELFMQLRESENQSEESQEVLTTFFEARKAFEVYSEKLLKKHLKRG